jgi:hypothetical protein
MRPLPLQARMNSPPGGAYPECPGPRGAGREAYAVPRALDAMQRSYARAHRLEERRIRFGDRAFKKLFGLRLGILVCRGKRGS